MDDKITPLYNYYHGMSASEALQRLRSWVGREANKEDCAYFYVGQTRDPEERFVAHQNRWAKGHKWDSMEVIYGSRFMQEVNDVENGLIKTLQKHEKYEDYSLNSAGARYDGNTYFYVYVMIDNQETDKPGKKAKDDHIVNDKKQSF